jgi:Major Facilitator Superfamily
VRLFRVGLIVFVLASIAGGLAVEPVLLIASRIVQGVGAAIVAPAGLSLLVTTWPEERERSHALGVYGAVVSTGFASGAVLGGLLVEVDWRLVFFVNAPIGLLLLVASYRLMPADPPRSPGRLDLPGAVTVTAGVALLVFAVARAGDTLSIGQPVVLAVVALGLLGAFVVRERRAESPLLNLALLRDRGILGANVSLIAVGAFNAGQVLLVTLYLQDGRHLTPLVTGLCFVAQAAGAFTLSGPASSVVPNLGARRSLSIAMLVALVALAGGALAVAVGSIVALLVTLLLMGAAARISMVASTLAGTHGPVALRSEGTASALLTATRQCGSALGVALLSATLVVAPGSTTQRTEIAMIVATCFALAGLLATRIVPAGPAGS